MKKKYVYLFSEGNADMRELLGGKGANLCEMTRLGLPVPKGFVVSTETCREFYANNGNLSEKIEEQIFEALAKIEKETGKKLGSQTNSLILSIRSGARVSMPGMMDSILNLGLNDEIVKSFAKQTNPRFAYDCYRRFIQMYSNVVVGINIGEYERVIDKVKKENKIELDKDLTLQNLKDIIKEYKKIYLEQTGGKFPQDLRYLLLSSIKAVFRSWNNQRAILYRRMNNIPNEWGTAVNIQQMVFGNFNEKSGTGVAFTRNPSTGRNEMYGEYLMNAQGEDVVAGIRTPSPIADLKKQNPKIYEEFISIAKMLEKHYRDMQDMEFTIEDGKLYILQTRNGKRTAKAGLKIAVDLVEEGEISEREAISRLEPNKLDSVLHPVLDENALKNKKPIATGLPASPGGASGQIVFSPEKAVELKEKHINSILVRLETSPEDIEGMTSAQGILTARGGMTSHAAVVARGLGTVCITGCEKMEFSKNGVKIGDKELKEGDVISLDGGTGNVYAGEVKTIPAKLTGDFGKVMEWSEKFKTIKVYANADTSADAQNAYTFGAVGVGLCRTEHMFFEENRILAMREMILATTTSERKKALRKLLPYQQTDFKNIFKEMKGLPVTIRLLDPPLHEFLPKTDAEILELSQKLKKSEQEIRENITRLHEFNPMLGHRGLRLAVTYPEIYEMQTKAIILGALEAKEKYGVEVEPEIMLPLSVSVCEFLYVKQKVVSTINKIFEDKGVKIPFKIGTMIETPRAVMIAGKLAKHCDFFSFGTNDLTQLTYAFSRDDAGKFLDSYYKKVILKTDPFTVLDREGVGLMIKVATIKARKANPNIKLGVCGEHAGEESSIEFFQSIGLDYVSCSPYRVPIARLASAKLNRIPPR